MESNINLGDQVKMRHMGMGCSGIVVGRTPSRDCFDVMPDGKTKVIFNIPRDSLTKLSEAPVRALTLGELER